MKQIIFTLKFLKVFVTLERKTLSDGVSNVCKYNSYDNYCIWIKDFYILYKMEKNVNFR